MPWTPPASVKTVAIRPLNKGMVTEMNSQHLPDGSFVLLKNMYGGNVGPKRYPGSVAYAGGDSFLFNPHSYFTSWRSDGTQTNVLLCDYATYEVDPNVGFTEIVWENTVGTQVVVSGLGVTGTATDWLDPADDVKKGDVLYVTDGPDTYYGIIDNITSDTALTLISSNIPDDTYTTFSIHRTFKTYVNPFADYVNIGDYTLIATGYGARPLVCLDAGGGTATYWMDAPTKYPDGTNPVYPSLVAYFDDRVWIADTYDAVDGRRVNRIRWSNLADPTDFSTATNYVDLPYSSSRIVRIVPLNDMLIVYFRDCIFVGRRTNYPNAPVAFFQAESLGLGLTGMKAILPFYMSHIIITKLGPYVFDGSTIQALPCSVLQDFNADNINPEYNRIVFDEERGVILFCLADLNNNLVKEYVYDVTSKAWSVLDISSALVDSPNVTSYTTIDALSGDIDAQTVEIDSFGTYQDKKTIFFSSNQSLFRTTSAATLRFDNEPIIVELITQDFDFDTPDDSKAFYRLGLKIDWRTPPALPIQYTVQGSTNRGRVWKTLGTLTIPVGEDEGYCNFRLSGSTARFRLVSGSEVVPYNISEITLKARMAGNDEALNSQRQ